jgi:hypothetical protein
MPEHITNEEMEPIKRFASTPVFRREPDQLLPDS